MPLPIGHTLISTAVFVAYKGSISLRDDIKGIALFAFAGLLPDIDFITVPFMGFGAHRGITHSIVFAFFAATLIYALSRYLIEKKGPRLLAFLFAAISIHPLCDFLTYDYLVERGGVMLLYPFTERYFESPVTLFVGIELRYLETILSLHTVYAVIHETVLAGIVLFLVIWWKKGVLRRNLSTREQDA